ncbi:hypothetical protein ACFE04_003470 [Oxalis oulophora]
MEFSFLTILFFIVLLSLTLLFLTSTSHKKSARKPGFKHYPIVGVLPEFLINRHRFLDWITEVLSRCPTNTSYISRPGGVRGIITANPSNIEYMLKTNFDNYPKGEKFSALLHDFLGRGIFNADGEIWKMQRKNASFEFNTKSLRNFVIENVQFELSERLVPVLDRTAQLDEVIDLQNVFERFAFDNICKLAFNVDPGCLGEDTEVGNQFMRAFEDATNLSSARFLYAVPGLWRFKKFFNFGSERVLKDSIFIVHQFADNIIKSAMESGGKHEDLLSRFIRNEKNPPEFLRDIAISFILAGRDTTSTALTWFFWLLSLHPEVEEKILNEQREIRARTGKVIGDTFSFEEIREMYYLQAAISESMRLYPPVAVDTKKCERDDILPDGTTIGKGWFLTYSAYCMGRMESIWGKDCLEFRPDRFLDESGFFRQENPFKYTVFHAGPRICLGKDMAYIQMKSIAASVIERFVIDVKNKSKTPPDHVLSLTLRMKGGLQVRVKARDVLCRHINV